MKGVRLKAKQENPKEFAEKHTAKTIVIALVILPLVCLIVSLCVGRFGVTPAKAISIMASNLIPLEPDWTGIQETVIMKVRFPRALLAMLVGSGLAIAGASFQGLFRNPLVSPGILGVAAGAGFGACVGILISGAVLVVQSISFGIGLVAVVGAYLISKLKTGSSLLMLVLSGVIIGAFFQAMIGIAKTVADPEEQLPAIVYWLLGSIAGATYNDLLWGAPPILLGIAVLLALRWRINILSLGEEEAKSLGVNTTWLRWTVVIAATVITAASVSLCGMVGWIGLVIPHIGRMLVGPNHKVLLPACVSIGAFSVLIIDDIARSATAAEIPLGILTAVVGAPFFAYLLRRTGGRWA